MPFSKAHTWHGAESSQSLNSHLQGTLDPTASGSGRYPVGTNKVAEHRDAFFWETTQSSYPQWAHHPHRVNPAVAEFTGSAVPRCSPRRRLQGQAAGAGWRGREPHTAVSPAQTDPVEVVHDGGGVAVRELGHGHVDDGDVVVLADVGLLGDGQEVRLHRALPALVLKVAHLPAVHLVLGHKQRQVRHKAAPTLHLCVLRPSTGLSHPEDTHLSCPLIFFPPFIFPV